MTIKDCIDIVDNLKPNQYTIKDKVGWLSFIEEIIINEVLKTHEGYDGRYDLFEGYSEDKLSTPLIVASPYDRLYTEYLKMKIDEANGEIARYNNSRAMYESHMTEFRKHYNKTHMPISTVARRGTMPPQKVTSGITDAQYENLKRDISRIMEEQILNATSPDKIADVVTKFVQNNIEMLKGKDGDAYVLTDEDKKEIQRYIGEHTAIIKADIEGIQEDIKNEAHFRGYLSTNAKIRALQGTPNDYAYSAESGTKWIYDAENCWQDTGKIVPDQLTPASDTSPLIDGVASVGSEQAYARGDHRHPTDTTRASVTDLNKLRADMEAMKDDMVEEILNALPNAEGVEF